MNFGEYAPDVAELDANVMAVALNVYPGANSYQPVKGPAPYSTAFGTAPRSLFTAFKEAGTAIDFAGSASNLYKLNTSTLAWDSVGSGYSVPADENWTWCQFGNYALTVNLNDNPQKFNVESDSSFSDLGGSPPKARVIDVVEDYVFLGALLDDPFAVQNSGTNDAASWTDGTDNSSIQSFPDGGKVQNIAGAAQLIIQEKAIRQIVFMPGSNPVFQYHKLEDAKGSIAPYSVIKFGPAAAYLAEDGFWFNGQPIGHNKVNQTFLSTIDQQRLFGVLGSFDPTRPLFYWAYKTSTSDYYDRMMVYNWRNERWSELQINLYAMTNIATPGITLEGLSTLYPNLDVDVPYSLDSRVWLGGRPTFGVVADDLKLSFFEGDHLEATLEPGEKTLVPGKRALVTAGRPLVDTDGAVLRVRTRNRLADTGAWGSEASMQTSGMCRVRSAGRYHRFRVRIPEGETWTHAIGIDDVDVTALGLR